MLVLIVSHEFLCVAIIEVVVAASSVMSLLSLVRLSVVSSSVFITPAMCLPTTAIKIIPVQTLPAVRPTFLGNPTILTHDGERGYKNIPHIL